MSGLGQSGLLVTKEPVKCVLQGPEAFNPGQHLCVQLRPRLRWMEAEWNDDRIWA
jgi:hypothetical protein